MAQQYIQLKSMKESSYTTIKQPDEGLGYDFETTYTEDTTRLASGVLNLKPMFTVEALSYSASNITKNELSVILRIVAKGNKFYMHYYSPYYNAWRDDLFYVGKGNLSIGRLVENGEVFKSLSIQFTGVNPL